MTEEKRMISEYEITQSIQIGDKEVAFGVATTNDNPQEKYMCTFVSTNELMELYDGTMVSDDYLEIMEIYTQRVAQQINNEKENHTDTAQVITANMCYPNDYTENIQGKIVAIKPSRLRYECQRGENQLVIVTGGFGSHANAHGSACFCTNIFTSEKSRYERHDILGEIKEEHIPEWAFEKLPNILMSIPDWNFARYTSEQEDRDVVKTRECIDFIKNNVIQADMHYPIIKDSVKELVNTFGLDMSFKVVGNTLSQRQGDSRIDKRVAVHASNFINSITGENRHGLNDVHTGILDLIYKGIMKEERTRFTDMGYVFNGNDKFRVIDYCNDATLLQRFIRSKTEDPSPFIVVTGVRENKSGSISWDFGKYHANLDTAKRDFSEHFNDTERLAKKVNDEHNTYINETLTLTPKEVFSRSYQTNVYADLAMIFEEKGLESLSINVPLLLKSDNILKTLYNEWLSTDDNHMEDLRDVINDYSNNLINDYGYENQDERDF